MENIYSGKFTEPSDDFSAVRDGRTSPVFYLDIDLSSSRDATNPLLLDFAGNSFYVDANPNDGTAIATFMQRDTGRADCPFYVSPGFIVNLPFTRVMFQNTAQAGKKIRVFYGVDVDFQPGAVSQIAIAGNVINSPLDSGRYPVANGVSVFAGALAPFSIAASGQNVMTVNPVAGKVAYLKKIRVNVTSGGAGATAPTIAVGFVSTSVTPSTLAFQGYRRFGLTAAGALMNCSTAGVSTASFGILPILGTGLFELNFSDPVPFPYSLTAAFKPHIQIDGGTNGFTGFVNYEWDEV